jgi:hypothetical protein
MLNGYMNIKNNVEGRKYVLNAIFRRQVEPARKFTKGIILSVLQSVSILTKFSAYLIKSALLTST